MSSNKRRLTQKTTKLINFPLMTSENRQTAEIVEIVEVVEAIEFI